MYEVISFSDLVDTITKVNRITDITSIREAYNYANNLHSGVKRKSGEDYIVHPLRVAKIVAEWGFDDDVVCAALLHDVLEDCKEKGASYEALAKIFNDNIASMVDTVTALDESEHPDLLKADLDRLSDIRLQKLMTVKALFVKAADRIDNLKTIGVMEKEKQIKKASHTRRIIIPMLRDEGALHIIDILEELCFKVENENTYNLINSCSERIRFLNKKSISATLNTLEKCFNGDIATTKKEYDLTKDIIPLIHGFKWSERSNSSIFRYLKVKSNDINVDYDRFLTKEHIAFYDLTLLVKDSFNDSPVGIFIDLYDKVIMSQQIFITRICKTTSGETNYIVLTDSLNNHYRLFIRTYANYEHYLYGNFEKTGLLYTENELSDTEPTDTYKNKIVIFDRDMKKKVIPEGATVLDFAFTIHEHLGTHFDYAKVNGHKCGPDRVLNDGDQVIIFKREDSKANIQWFNCLKTSDGTRKLVKYLTKNQ